MADEVNVKITGTSTDLQNAMKQGAQSVRTGMSEIKEAVQGAREGIEDLGASMSLALETAGVMLAVEAVTRLSEKLQEMGERAIQIQSMGIVLGVTTDQVQGLGEAGEQAGVKSEMLFRALEKLKQLLDEARGGSADAIDKFLAMGLTLEQITDKSFGTAEMVAALSARLNDAATATETMNALTKELGARQAMSAVAIKEVGGKVENLTEKMKEVNGLSDYQIGRLKEMGVWWKDVGNWIGNASAKLTVWSADVMRAYADAQVAEDAARFGPAGGADSKGQRGPAQGHAASRSGDSMIEELNKETKARMKAIEEEMAATRHASKERLDLLKEYYQAALQIYGSDTVDVVRKAKIQMIEADRAYNDEQGRLDKESERKKTESAQRILAVSERKAHNQIALDRQELIEAGKYLDQQGKLEEEGIAHSRQMGIEQIAYKKQELDAMAEAGVISRRDQLQGEQDLEQARYRLELASLQDRLALVELEPEKRKEVLDQIELLEEQHQTKMRGIDLGVIAEQQSGWKSVFSSMQSGIQSVLARFISFQLSVRNLLRGLATSVADSWAQMVARNIASMVTWDAVSKKFHLSQVARDAKEAAAGAYKAVVGIPYVGPFLAPVAAGVAFAGVMAFSAKDGFDIPAGVNPVTQLHAREMVLPEKQADAVRDMAEGRGGGGTMYLPTKRVGRGEMLIRERDLVDVLRRLGVQNFRPA